MIIDTHCHLNDDKLYPIRNEIVNGFSQNNIEKAICVAYDIPSSYLAVEIANEFENVYAAIGIHPHDAKTWDETAKDQLIELSKNNKVIAIGEIGLDYYYDLSPRDIQIEVFKKQLQLANQLGLPAILHIRDAYEDARMVLEESKTYLSNGILLHCCSCSKEMVPIFDKYNAYYSFGGAITFKNAKHNLETLKAISKDKLLAETDCPYMTPVPFRGQINEPKYVNLVVERMAELLDMNVEDVENLTTNNAKKFFRI